MITYQEACAQLRALGLKRPVGTETLALQKATGRILAQAVRAQEAVPPFDNSAMDGFAVKAAWLESASRSRPVTLKVSGALFAGDAPQGFGDDSPSAIEMMTGAPTPGAPWDSVVKIEDTEVLRDDLGRAQSVSFFAPAEAGAHIRRAGEDFQAGQPALQAGELLTPERILALATLGVSRVEVRKKIRVAILSTGRELVDHEIESLPPGKIRNSTAPFLLASLPDYGAESVFLGVIDDDPRDFEARMRQALRQSFDLILTTGAVSMGQADFIGASLESLGAEILFHKVAIRPGKPLLCARFSPDSGPIFLGLPGNPVSTAVGLRFFASVYLRAAQGRAPESPHRAILMEPSRKPEGLRCFFKALVGNEGATLQTIALQGQASFMVSPLLAAQGWVVFPEEGREVRKGDEVQVFPLHPDGTGFAQTSPLGGMSFTHKKECC